MKDVKTISMVRDMFKILAENEYSLLWDLVENFTCNGHEVSVKESTQFKHVVIDGRYVTINPNHTVQANGVNYTGLEYAMHVLEEVR